MKQPEETGRPAGGERCRAIELDALRGLALLMMILHHLAFDLRYLLNLDVFAFQETSWFALLLRPFFLNVFLVVSGICCTFSRSNTRRGLRLLAVAVFFSLATSLFSSVTDISFYILFNVLHVLSIGILLYAGLTVKENRQGRPRAYVDLSLMLLAVIVIYLGGLLDYWPYARSAWTMPFGLVPAGWLTMNDYLPLLPWLGFFLIGAQIGRVVYPQRLSLLPPLPRWARLAGSPLVFLGQHSLLVYILHQPILLGLLFALRAIGLL